MTNVETQSEQTTLARRSRWPLAIIFTSLVTLAGFIVALQQFTGKFLWDESLHTRTIGGVLYMLLGLVGLYLPYRLIRRREQFPNLSPPRQWFNILGVPLLYLLAFAACFEASLRSKTMILPRPFTPTIVVIYDTSLAPQSRTRIEFRNALRQDHLTSIFDRRSNDDDVVERFHAGYDEGFLRHHDRLQMATLDGETRQLEDGLVKISIHVDAKERLQFSVLGLDNVVITRDGDSINESDAKSGKYQVVIIGQPKKGHITNR